MHSMQCYCIECGYTAKEQMMDDTHAVALIERMLHEGFAGGDPTVVDRVCSPELEGTVGGPRGSGV